MKELPITELTHPAEGKVYLIAAGPGFVTHVYGPLEGTARFTPQSITDTGDRQEVAYLEDGVWTFHGQQYVYDSVNVFRAGPKPRYKLCRMTGRYDASWDMGTWKASDDGWTKQEWLELQETVCHIQDAYYDAMDLYNEIEDWQAFAEIGAVVDAGPDAIVHWLYPELERIDDTVMAVLI